MVTEYSTIEEITGPLVLLDDVDHATYEEVVEVELPAGTRRGTLDVSWSVPGARISGAVVVVAIALTIGLLVLRRRLAPDGQDA